MALQSALAKVREAPFILDAVRAADELVVAAGNDGGPHAASVLAAAVRDDDQVTAIAAVHALGAVFDDRAARELSELLSDPRTFLREHAAWALGTRVPRLDAVGRLVAGVADGGFVTVINQRTLRRWAHSAPDHVALALEGALLAQEAPDARVRLVETMGLVSGSVARRAVLRVAAAPYEADRVRQAAVAALGDRGERDTEVLELIGKLATTDGELGAVAALATFDLGERPPEIGSAGAGLSIAQLFLHADLDRELSRAGVGDNGGIATMLVRLGDALAAEPAVDRVLTMSRGSSAAAVAALSAESGASAGHLLTPIPLMSEPVDAARAWPVNVAAERGIRRALTAHGRVDVLHLRMADVGSMAASTVATRLGIPTVFTLAPDPHAVIHALDMTGALSRNNFGAVDENEHYWFRTGLVRRLAAGAYRCALFPRPQLRHQLRDLLGVDIEAEPRRYTVVPEGIDLTVSDAARLEAELVSGVDRPGSVARSTSSTAALTPAFADLHGLIAALPAERQGLPVALTVGRLHRVKGMATVVEAWAADPALWQRCNLLVVGGDLHHPSADEQGQLDAIAAVMAQNPHAAAGLVLAGHRPNDVVARWVAAAHTGLPASIAPAGVYVCGSLKEEFGLALIEALAAGLVVVGPDAGGPATYVDEGVTGFLVDTRSPAAVAIGVARALELAADPAAHWRVDAARRLVHDRYTIQAMARTLSGIYAGIAAPVAG
ncbi:MAG TPA: glycosyltransferase [Nakamurella sp.]|nr:glycosyltransferase [Nakamurella sp.]